MCAINGFNWKDSELLVRMNKRLNHRGPDGTGVFVNDLVSLGHNRLSIIDTREIAAQPMISNDKNLTIIFNGEIYNFLELKNDLLSDYPFKTNSDTEVILAAYQKWGKNCLKYLNGIFAFAIWNDLDKSLFIVRDPVGVKPLYYFWNKGLLIFSSEIKAILEHPIPRNLNIHAFNQYLRLLYVPEPDTLFEGIKKLSPGHFLFLKNNNLTIEPYVDYGQKCVDEEIVLSVDSLRRSIQSQLISDRPVGVYLSGGIDSSSILHFSSEFRTNINTFSVGFELDESEDLFKFNQDFILAGRTAAYYNTKHHEVILSKKEVIPLLREAIYHLDEPLANPTIIPMLKLSKYAKNFTPVILGGDGGDELFGGYERYRLSLLSIYYKLLPNFLKKTLEFFNPRFKKLSLSKGIDQFELFMFQNEEEIKSIINKKFLIPLEIIKNYFKQKYFDQDNNLTAPEMLMKTDQKSWLVDESLLRADKLSMASGVEQRVPLLDLRLVLLSNLLPIKSKVSILKTKKNLRKLMKRKLPSFLFKQPKRGWFSPGAKWLRDPEIKEFCNSVLNINYYQPTSSLFDWSGLIDMFNKHISKKKYNSNLIWAVISFQLWAKEYKVEIK